jgi:hypothetical protein
MRGCAPAQLQKLSGSSEGHRPSAHQAAEAAKPRSGEIFIEFLKQFLVKLRQERNILAPINGLIF